MSIGVRGASHRRRGRAIRRASAGLSLARLGALAVLLAVTVALEYLAGGPAFAAATVEIEGAAVTDPAAVEAAVIGTGARRPNLFRFDSAAASARLTELPSVRRAEVRAALPDRLIAHVEERTAILAWVVGEVRFLVDGEGLLFAEVPPTVQPDLPVVRDDRSAAAELAVGSRLDPIELQVARQLVAVTPALLGSAAPRLGAAIGDSDGFTLTAEPGGWVAVFGLYGAVTRSPGLIPLQVQCLASLISDRGEGSIGHVVLSPEGQLCGTFGPP